MVVGGLNTKVFSRLAASKRRMNKHELEDDDDHDDSLDEDEVAYPAE